MRPILASLILRIVLVMVVSTVVTAGLTVAAVYIIKAKS